MKPGTYDFYFDTADQLVELGDPFVILVKRGDGIVSLSNVDRERDAGRMEQALGDLFRGRFGGGASSSQEDPSGPES